MNHSNTLCIETGSHGIDAMPSQTIMSPMVTWAAASGAMWIGFGVPALAWAAERGRADQNDSSTAALAAVAMAAVAAGLVAAAIWCLRRWYQRRKTYSHALLFKDLCRLHNLARRDRALLAQLAQAFQIAHPARVFVEPKWLDVAESHPALSARRGELASLRARVFAEETDA